MTPFDRGGVATYARERMDDSSNRYVWPFEEITDGEWAGWKRWVADDPFEMMCGPFYWREEGTGIRTAFRVEQKHLNGGRFLHGGMFMTFADYCLFAFAYPGLTDSYGVTATLNAEFVGSAHAGDLVEGTGELVRAGGALLFVRGLITTADRPLLTFSGVVKKVRPRS